MQFIGDVNAKWLEDGRQMQLLRHFIFVDNKGKHWMVPKGAVIDGASIPRVFWRVIGSPFTGKYRRASVIHDYYCNVKTEPYKDVHNMFYNAMICEGAYKVQAYLMWKAVLWFGPKWKTK